MRTEERIYDDIPPSKAMLASTALPEQRRYAWLTWQSTPLWLCLLIALGIRILLVIQTHGFIDGDEALVGIQAQHILHGELPVYYYGQPYMGSLEAYLIALLFALFGSSTWVMRMEPLLLSLVLVWLTWRLANALADQAGISPKARRWFSTISTLFAAIPPLYDGIIELRTWGGHIETYVLTLLLLLSALRLTQRWQASIRERTLRWAGIGFLVGLGMWVYPLIITAILTTAIWIMGFCIVEIARVPASRRSIIASTLRRLALAAVAIPTSLIGFLPALLWGATHRWANVLFIFSPANNGSNNLHLQLLYPDRLSLLRGTIALYLKCVAPHVIGGALPDTHIRFSLLQASIGSAASLTLLVLLLLSFFQHNRLLLHTQQLMLLPMIFGSATALVFCTSSISSAGLLFPCTRDEVGRYAAPLSLVLPFFFAGIALFIHTCLSGRNKRPPVTDERRTQKRLPDLLYGALRLFLLLYIIGQGSMYALASTSSTFQSFACAVAPLNDEPIIAYMQREHIKYAWGTVWIGNIITFKTNSEIIVADPRIITVNADNRLPANTRAVRYANRPAIVAFVLHGDAHPALLRALDAKGITYSLGRFPAEQGRDVLVVIPDRTLSPFYANALGSWFSGC